MNIEAMAKRFLRTNGHIVADDQLTDFARQVARAVQRTLRQVNDDLARLTAERDAARGETAALRSMMDDAIACRDRDLATAQAALARKKRRGYVPFVLSEREVNEMVDTARRDASRQGQESMRERAARTECQDCKSTVPFLAGEMVDSYDKVVEGPWHKHASGRVEHCVADRIRALPILDAEVGEDG